MEEHLVDSAQTLQTKNPVRRMEATNRPCIFVIQSHCDNKKSSFDNSVIKLYIFNCCSVENDIRSATMERVKWILLFPAQFTESKALNKKTFENDQLLLSLVVSGAFFLFNACLSHHFLLRVSLSFQNGRRTAYRIHSRYPL